MPLPNTNTNTNNSMTRKKGWLIHSTYFPNFYAVYKVGREGEWILDNYVSMGRGWGTLYKQTSLKRGVGLIENINILILFNTIPNTCLIKKYAKNPAYG